MMKVVEKTADETKRHVTGCEYLMHKSIAKPKNKA